MPLLRSLGLACAATLLLSAPAFAANPASGSVSLANPTTSWTGTAAGWAVGTVSGLCAAPTCDTYTLTVSDPGDLTLSATANVGDSRTPGGFTYLQVVRPDGTSLSTQSAADVLTAEIVIKRAKAGAYTVRVRTNKAIDEDASYRAAAVLSQPDASVPPLGHGHGEGGPRDATVVAVIDSSFNPYHWDFLASKMPQATNADRGDDLPLDQPASEWLPGFTAPSRFDRLDLTLEEKQPDVLMNSLREADAERWSAVKPTTPEEPQFYWLPRTKVIAAASFAATGSSFLGPNDAHGAGTSSAAAGNLHGTCPECVLVLLKYSGAEQGERAIEWAMRQPWIDVISNSYGFGGVIQNTSQSNLRDNMYDGSNTAASRAASDRGQTIVFSAGNGLENGFVVPMQTTFSSQKGPDWMITVGAVSPPEDGHYSTLVEPYPEESGAYTGAGKPVDVAGVGSNYPTAYRATTVGGTGSIGFSGTSNAAPTISGTFARSLYSARTLLPGPSRAQKDGVIARGGRFKCGAERTGCELGDGSLTAAELRTRLLHGAVHTGNGATITTLGGPETTLPPVGEETLLGEGHGTYLARVRKGSAGWADELFRISGPLTGAADVLQRPEGEREWMIVDSYCRQKNWGSWTGGYYVEGQTALPGDDPDWPVRSARERTCPGGSTPLS